MGRITVTRLINAPIATVFKTISDIDQFARALPHIIRVEHLNDLRGTVGARFRETRLLNGTEVSTDLEITELIPNDRVRLVTESHGAFWDSLFTVEPEEGRTRLTMVMNFRTRGFSIIGMVAMIGGALQRAIEKDMDMVKAYCEGTPRQTANAG